jgi:serine protease AprX
VITVGALDHNETVSTADDSLASYSSRGKTEDGVYKPDLIAPGRKIVAPLAGPNVVLAQQLPDHIVDGTYLRLSGTSMAAPVTAGVVALVLQRYPNLTPDQVKWLLTNTARTYAGQADQASVVDPLAALKRAAWGNVGQANQGLVPSGGTLLSPVTTLLGGLLGGSGLVADAGFWNAGFWNAGFWNAGFWNAGFWNAGFWNAGFWNGGTWDAGFWNAGSWDAGFWNDANID